MLIIILFTEVLSGLIIGSVIRAFGSVFLMASLNALVADVGDLVYWKSGIPVQGTVFSIGSVSMKVVTGFAAGMVGWVLALGAYVTNSAVKSESYILAIKFLYIYFPFICTIILTVAIFLLNYEKFISKIKEAIKMEKVELIRDESILKN